MSSWIKKEDFGVIIKKPNKEDVFNADVSPGDFIIIKAFSGYNTGWLVFGKFGSNKKSIIHETNVRIFSEIRREIKRKEFDFTKDIETLSKKAENWWDTFLWNPNFGKQCEKLFSNIQEIFHHFFAESLPDNLFEQLFQLTIPTIEEMQHMIQSPKNFASFFPKFDKYHETSSEFMKKDIIPYKKTGKLKGKIADESNSSILELSQLYYDKEAKIDSQIEEFKKKLILNKDTSKRKFTVFSSKKNQEKGHHQQQQQAVTLPDLETQFQVTINKFGYNMDDKVEVQFYLYSGIEKKFISEPFQINLEVNKNTERTKLINFENLEKRDYDRQLYLVVRVYRIGDLLHKKESAHHLKRPHGIAVAALSNALLVELFDGLKLDETLTLYTCKEDLFHNFHQIIIDTQSQGSYNLQELHFEKSDKISLPLNVEYSIVQKKYSEWIDEDEYNTNIPSCKLLKFSEVIEPSCLRNDIYLMLNSSYFQGLQDKLFKSAEKQYRNVLVKVKVLSQPIEDAELLKLISKQQQKQQLGDTKMELVKQCIFSSVPEARNSNYTTAVQFHVQSPTWNEMIRLNIKPQVLPKSYIMFHFFKVSTKNNAPEANPFGFAYLKLMTSDGLCLPEKDYHLTIFKYEKDIDYKIDKFDLDQDKQSKLYTKSIFDIETVLVSTELTYDENLKNLLNWKESKSLESVIKKFFFIKKEEVLAFLRGILDSLFSILHEKSNEKEIRSETIKAIVNLISSIVSVPKYKDYQLVLHEYIESNMKSPSLWIVFLDYLSFHFDEANIKSTGNSYFGEIVKSLNFLFKIIHFSRLQFEKDTNVEDKLEFQSKISDVMKKLNLIVKSDSTTYKVVQSILFKYIGPIFDHITYHFETKHAGQMVLQFVDGVKSQRNFLASTLSIIFNGKVFANDNLREFIFPELISDLITLFDEFLPVRMTSLNDRNSYHDKRLRCLKIFKNVLNCIPIDDTRKPAFYENVLKLLPFIHKTNETLILEMEFDSQKITSLTREIKKFQMETTERNDISRKLEPFQKHFNVCHSHKIILLSCLLSLISNLKSNILENVISSTYELVSQINKIQSFTKNHVYEILMFIDSLNDIENVIPEYWISFNKLMYQNILTSYENINDFLIKSKFDKLETVRIWNDYFFSLFKFITNPKINPANWNSFQIEKLKECSFREKGIQIFSKSWELLEDLQVEFVPFLIEYILPLFNLIENEKVNNTIIDIYYGVLANEYSSKTSLKQCEGTTQRCIVSSNMTPTVTNKFIEILKMKFEIDEQLKEPGIEFIERINELLLNIKDVHKFSDEEQKADACVKVMNYFIEHNNLDLYFSYVHKLSKMHLYLENYSEVAHCYLLHLKYIGNSKDILPAVGIFPKQTEGERRESLLEKAMMYLTEDDDWEKGIEVGKELQKYYEETYQYSKLKHLLPLMGEYFDSILTKSRRKKSYFNVLILGKDADDKGEYIYRENKILLTEFIQKLKSTRKNCEVIRNIIKPEQYDEYNSRNGVFIHISTMETAYEHEMVDFDFAIDRNVPPQVTEYETINKVKLFKKSKRYNLYQQLTGKKPKNDYKHLYRDTIFKITETDFPSIKRRLKVIETKQITLDPLENAVRDIEDKIREITLRMITENKVELERVLTGTIDAAVLGGEGKYIEAFFSPYFIKTANDSQLQNLKRFQIGLKNQLIILKEAMDVFKRIIPGRELLVHLAKKLKEKEDFLLPVFQNKLDREAISDDILDIIDQEEEDLKLAGSKEKLNQKLQLNLGKEDGTSTSSSPSESLNPLISPRGFVPVSKSLENQSRSETGKVTPREFSLKSSTDIFNKQKNSPLSLGILSQDISSESA
eukprot:gene8360-185_t